MSAIAFCLSDFEYQLIRSIVRSRLATTLEDSLYASFQRFFRCIAFWADDAVKAELNV